MGGSRRPPSEAHIPTGGDPGRATTAHAYRHIQAAPVRLGMFPDGQSRHFPRAWVPPSGVRRFLSALTAHIRPIITKPQTRFRVHLGVAVLCVMGNAPPASMEVIMAWPTHSGLHKGTTWGTPPGLHHRLRGPEALARLFGPVLGRWWIAAKGWRRSKLCSGLLWGWGWSSNWPGVSALQPPE